MTSADHGPVSPRSGAGTRPGAGDARRRADASAVFRFGSFELRTRERCLLQDGAECPIGSRAFDVLLALLERRDRVVPKNELLDVAWPGLVVEENNLSVQVSALRKVLGASAISTVPSRGYQFALSCEVSAGGAAAGSQVQTERRIVALACAEVMHWRAFLDADRENAERAWEATRESVIKPQLSRFGGQPMDITAERLLIRFDSAVDAIAWALDLQERLEHARHNDAAPPMHMRVGVVVEEALLVGGKIVDDVAGPAERLQRSGGPDEVVVSDIARGFADKRLRVSFERVGDQQDSALGGPAQFYRVVPESRAPAPSAESPSPMWNRSPSIAVLPFEGINAETAEYFAQGMTAEIITGLSMNRSLIVIAGDSAREFRGTRVPGAAAARLGVRYILSGTVQLQRLPPKLWIDVKLFNADVGAVIWSERFEGPDDDPFTLQSKIAPLIIAAIDPNIRQAEIQRIRSKPTNDFNAYECVLRGISLQFGREEEFEHAGECFRRAIQIDPDYAQAHAHLARWHSLRIGEGRTRRDEDDRAAAVRLARRAVGLDDRDAWILATAGHIESFLLKRFAEALRMFDRALDLNPNSVTAWFRSGTTLAYIGRGEEALERVRNAMLLSPFDDQAYSFCTTSGTASIVNGRYDEAVVWLNRALQRKPNYRAATRLLIAALSLAGQVPEARERAREFLADEASFTVSRFGEWYPLQPPHLERVLDALRTAGLPG